MVGNGSGKYDYEPNKLDTDIQAILDKRKKFENDLRNLIFQEPFLVKERYKQAIEILIDIKKKEIQHKQNYKIKYKKTKRKILKILLHIFCLISQTKS